MKVLLKIIVACLMLLWQANVMAQSKTSREVNNKIRTVDNATKETGASIDNATKTLDNAKTLFKEISGKTSTDKNKMTIVVSGIRFNDSNLEALEHAIKKMKGAKKVSKSLQSGIITISLKYRYDANNLWNKIPAEIKKMYKPVEVADKNLLLDFIKQRKK